MPYYIALDEDNEPAPLPVVYAESDDEAQDEWAEYEAERCSNPAGHSWVYTGTAYGGDDERWCGEGRCYCRHCGADGDA